MWARRTVLVVSFRRLFFASNVVFGGDKPGLREENGDREEDENEAEEEEEDEADDIEEDERERESVRFLPLRARLEDLGLETEEPK